MFSCCGKISTVSTTTPTSSLVNLPVINWKDAMEQCGNDENFLKELLRETHKDILDIKPKLLDTETIPEETRDIAHMIKGVSQNLMCEDLANSCSELEETIREGNQNYTTELNNMLGSIERFENFMKLNDLLL